MQDASLVVIVEDEPITRAQLDAHFKDAGFETLCREDGEALEQIVEERSPDLVLLDIKLPGADGLTLTRALRAVSDVGIILVTSRHDQVDRIVGLESGADDYVTKPYQKAELLARIRTQLYSKESFERSQLQADMGNVSSELKQKLDAIALMLTGAKPDVSGEEVGDESRQ